MENAKLPCKTALPKANIKTNRMENAKWPYQKMWGLPKANFLENMSLINSYKQIIDLMYQLPKYPYSYISQALEFYNFRERFLCEYP